MQAKEADRKLLMANVLSAIEEGCWEFLGPNNQHCYCSDKRVNTKKMIEQRQRWLESLTNLVLESSSAGLVGKVHGDNIHWMQGIQEVFDKKEVELPVTELGFDDQTQQWGFPLNRYQPGSRVTIFQDITTTGNYLTRLQRFVEHRGLCVDRMVSLVNRNPEQMEEISGVSYASVLHFPMPLYGRSRYLDRCQCPRFDYYGACITDRSQLLS